MGITISPDFVRELHAYTENTGRSEQTGIVLEDTGWELAVWTSAGDRRDAALVALTGADVQAFLDEDGTLDADSAQHLAETATDGFVITDEGDQVVTVPADADLRVVTHRAVDRPRHAQIDEDSDLDFEPEANPTAWWFDLRDAVELVEEPRGAYKHGQATSLWRTAGGRYVTLTRSILGYPHEYWTELTVAQVAALAYHAEAEQVTAADDMIVQAARTAADLVATLVIPAVPAGDLGRRPEQVLAQATATVHATRAIGDLVRTAVTSQIRNRRADAARIVVAALGHGPAAKHLGIAPGTLSDLTRS